MALSISIAKDRFNSVGSVHSVRRHLASTTALTVCNKNECIFIIHVIAYRPSQDARLGKTTVEYVASSNDNTTLACFESIQLLSAQAQA